MPSWLLAIGGMFVKLLASIFSDAMKTPAEEVKTDVEEGNVSAPDPDNYYGLYGIDQRVQHRDED